MATVGLVKIYKDLANRPTISSRQMEYVLQRIEDELVKRARRALNKIGL